MKKDSPLYSALSFLKNIINDFDDESPFFYPLTLIDSGIFIYETKFRKELAYGYGIYPCNLIKEHLNDVIPEIIITINNKNYFKDDQGISEKSSGAVFLNLCSELLSPLEDINLYDVINNIDILNDLSLRLFLVLFHKLLGQKKSGYTSTNKEEIELSPNIFYDKIKKSILKLDYLYSNNILKNIIKILRDPESNSDSGSFLEYFLGECDYGFICHLIEEMLINNINLNFIFNANFWKKDINILREYIKLKYIVFFHKKNLLDETKFKDINEEMDYLQEIIKKIKLEDNEFSIKIKKNKENKINKKINYHDYDNLTIQDIKNLYMDKNTNYEEKQICKKLLLFRTERK